jgi:hypothetical protein
MRILTNISKAELDHLANQPTAKAMIEKVKTEGIYIPEGDAQAAADFVAMRDAQKREDTLHISDEGRASMQKEIEEKEKSSQEEQIKKKIAELQKELAKVNEKDDKDQNKKANVIMQQISMLSMQLVQLQKAKSESNV